MSDKIIKFVSTDICVMALLLVVLISHYTLVGLIAFFAGSILLFLGTIFDNQKANYGVTSKLAFIFFMTILMLLAMWMPFVFENTPCFESKGQSNILGMIVSIVLSLVFFVMAGTDKFKHYVVRRCLKYSGQIMLFLAVYYFWELPTKTFFITIFTVVLFLLTDLFVTKYRKYNVTEFKDLDDDKAFWMAFLINICFVAMNLFFRQYFVMQLSKNSLTKLINNILSGFNVPLFIILMVVLTVVYMSRYERLSARPFTYDMASDAFFTLSLGGFVLLLRIYASNKSIESFVILSSAVLMYFIFGYSILSANSGSKDNPVYYLLRLDGDAHIVISLAITIISIPAIIFANKGYIIPIVFVVSSAIIIMMSFIKLKNSWVKINMRWQITLLCILAFLISVSAVHSSLEQSLIFLISLFCVNSFAIWVIGVRQDIGFNKCQEVAQLLTCVASCGIGLIAV